MQIEVIKSELRQIEKFKIIIAMSFFFLVMCMFVWL